ncbi:MAG: PQQ-binding-like beta-propeller repeat protein [Litoreibacter sp.]|nr:PQQ-binding-like beta-propeller repeat protein [Litoreibacter sp.]
MVFSRQAILALGLLSLAACAEQELVLNGERFGTRDPLPGSQTHSALAVEPAQASRAGAAFNMPAQVNHQSWTHRNGTVARFLQHPALGAELTQVWSADIGAGNSRKARITTDPVVLENRIFTMDSASRVTATSVSGAKIWARDLVPSNEKSKEASGGGLAVSGSTLIAATGFGELYALDTASGATLWRQKLDAPVTSAPTVADGMVYVVSRDNRALALDLELGRIRWEVQGPPGNAVFNGGAGAIVSDRLVIFPFASGELTATLKKSGIRVWSASIVGQRRGQAYAGIPDISGDPVLAGNRIYAANQGGRAAALDVSSGERVWTANEGAYSPAWPASDSIFLISDQAELMRLDAGTGEKIWSELLPYFKRQKLKRRQAVYAHYGPILAGGRLLVASDDGLIRSFDPATGALVATTEIRGGAASNPVVVNGTLYVVTEKGQLAAFR